MYMYTLESSVNNDLLNSGEFESKVIGHYT